MSENKSNPLWNILRSVRLTLILLAVLATASIVGTLIQQQDSSAIYHSLWFRLIIFFLSINLIVCSIDRFPATLKLFSLIPKPDRSKVFDEETARNAVVSGADVSRALSGIQQYLRTRFHNLAVKENGATTFLYCEKGRHSLFSVYLVHLSVLFILIGAIIGSIFGFNGSMNIPEGAASNAVIISDGKTTVDRDLGFMVQCEKFFIDYYQNGVPKEYRSNLIFSVNGKEMLKGSLRVNHPITFMGITFYQASYGTVPGETARIKIINEEKNNEETPVELGKGKAVMLPDNKSSLTITDMRDDFMNLGPAVLVVIKSPEGKETPIWIFKNWEIIKKAYSDMFSMSSKFNPSAYKPFKLALDDMGSVAYTGLQVTRDPGVVYVFIGFAMIIIGLFLTFFTSHRKFWVRVSSGKENIKIDIAGSSNKNPVGLEKDLDRLLSNLKKAAEGNHND
jgi:cytochrome c biogenesis protein